MLADCSRKCLGSCFAEDLPGGHCRPLQERRRSYSEARDRLLEGGEPTRVPGRGFGRGNPSASSLAIGRSRGSGGRGRGTFRGQEDDVRDPDYER